MAEHDAGGTSRRVTRQNLTDLLRFRTELRAFQRWSEDQAREVGLTPMQHQLLLAIEGHEDRRGPTIADVARHLLVRHHSVIELLGRVEETGYVERRSDPDDGRLVRLRLTPSGKRKLHELSRLHLEELRRLRPALAFLTDDSEPGVGPAERASHLPSRRSPPNQLRRAR